jgi:NAD(P)H dehydrogenase (quinone)
VEAVSLPLEDPEALVRGFAGCSGALLVAPFGEMEAWHRAMGAAARSAGLEHVVKVSVTGARGPEADPPPGRIPSLHWQGEEILRQLELPLTVIRPTIYSQHFLGLSPALFSPGDDTIHLPTGQAGVAFLDCRDIAACAADLLSDADLAARWRGRAFELTGPAAPTAGELAAILSLVAERPIAPVDGLEAFSAHAASLGVPDTIRGIYAEAAGGWFAAVHTEEFQAITGRYPTSFASFAYDHRHYFQWPGERERGLHR